MAVLAANTVSKLFYLDSRIKTIYEKNGYSDIPLDSNKIPKMIEGSKHDLKEIFSKIWGTSMGSHLLDKFYNYYGNIYELFMCLDGKNRELFTGKDW